MGLSKEQRKEYARELCIKEWGFDPALMRKVFVTTSVKPSRVMETMYYDTIRNDVIYGYHLNQELIQPHSVLWVQLEHE